MIPALQGIDTASQTYSQIIRELVFKETVVLRRWGVETNI